MTCEDCERLLAAEEASAELDRHLAECAECRELASDVRANAEAFREMTAVELPSVRGAVLGQVRAMDARKRVMRWGWALAAAAVIVMGFFAARPGKVEPQPPVVIADRPTEEVRRQTTRSPAPQVAAVPRKHRQQTTRSPALLEPLKVKMLTSDPDVVIYWLVDPKEGSI